MCLLFSELTSVHQQLSHTWDAWLRSSRGLSGFLLRSLVTQHHHLVSIPGSRMSQTNAKQPLFNSLCLLLFSLSPCPPSLLLIYLFAHFLRPRESPVFPITSLGLYWPRIIRNVCPAWCGSVNWAPTCKPEMFCEWVMSIKSMRV